MKKIVVICFQISIFEPLETTPLMSRWTNLSLWFAFKLVSLNHWKQRMIQEKQRALVVICFQISIFEPLETTMEHQLYSRKELWFAFKLVSLNHWKQHKPALDGIGYVVICFQISIFEPLETTIGYHYVIRLELWFAFKLVSLNHWKQRRDSL